MTRWLFLVLISGIPAFSLDWNDIPHGDVMDTSVLQVGAADSVAARMGASRRDKIGLFKVRKGAFYTAPPTFRNGGKPLSFTFHLSRRPADDLAFAVLASPDPASRYGFTSGIGQPGLFEALAGRGKSHSLEQTLLSAYQQQVDAIYRDTLTEFMHYPQREAREFDRRNWLSSGYATQYAYTRNPFLNSGNTSVAIGYLMDAMSLFIAIGGGAAGRTATDKVGFAVTGVALNFLWKWAYRSDGIAAIDIYNGVTQSGYKIPPLE